MSLSEAQRFSQDLKSRPDLLALAKGTDLDGLVRLAGQHGYKFTHDDAKDLMRTNAKRVGKTLTDEEIDRIAGGAGVCSTCQPGRNNSCHMYGCSAKR